jgi:uncharacterized protein YndB with AHSA1/START domain
MTSAPARLPEDEARVSVQVAVPPERAFRIFTEEIDQWWRHGREFRAAAPRPSVVHLEPGVGGRLFESFEGRNGPKVLPTGTITVWEPPARFVFDWRALNFAPAERTEVEVRFVASGSGTLVTVIHRGWSAIRPDHPARHGLAPEAFLRMMGLWWGKLMSSLREQAHPPEP